MFNSFKKFSIHPTLLLILIFLFGCNFHHKITYAPSKNAPNLFDSRIGKIYIFPFEDKLENPSLIKNIGFTGSSASHFSVIPLKDIIHKGFQKELEKRGLILTNNLEESAGYIKGTLKNFEYSDSLSGTLSSRATVGITLYSMLTKRAIWKEKTTVKSASNIHENKSIQPLKFTTIAWNAVMNKLIQRAVNNPDFHEALLTLSN
jgi:hypothetical protein